MQLSVIIVNYNVKYFLEQCLHSVQKAIQNLDAEVWVTDNASPDNSVEYLEPKFSWVNFIRNETNPGFAKANNQALHKCSGEYILFLNPDTLLPEDALTKCITFMKSHAQAGALGIRMIDGSATFLPESKRSFPSPLTSLYKLSGLSWLFPKSKIFSRYSLAYLNEFKNYEVDVLAGAFMLSRKNLLIDLKGFDEAFFMYGEDIDLSYRIQKSGYKNYYFSESTIIHFKGESTHKGSLKYVKMFYQAMSIFVKKHYTGRSAQLFTHFLQAAIWFRAGASVISQFLAKRKILLKKINISRKKKTYSGIETKNQIIVAGTEEEFEEVKRIFAGAGVSKQIARHIDTSRGKESVSAIISDLQALAESGDIKEIVFCQGHLSYTDIIQIIQKLPEKIFFRFHAKGSESIVGSDSKNTSGEVIGAG